MTHARFGTRCARRLGSGFPLVSLMGVVLGALLTGCHGGADGQVAAQPTLRPAVASEAPSTVVLISLDGTRPADVNERFLPSLFALGERGLRGDGLIPPTPSNTFPSHVSMATGVPPEQHGIVNNRFIDPVRGKFQRPKTHEWIQSEPIWSIAERNGVPTASYYWVGSEDAWPGGPGPRDTRKFSGRTSEKTKVNRILKWLSEEDPAKRPRLIVSWFHGADHAAHASGPGTDSVRAALAPQDEQIARLVRTMDERGLFATTTLIFVSDHGMTLAKKRVYLSSKYGGAKLGVSVIGTGGFSTVVFKKGKKTPERMRRAVEIAREAGLEAWPREDAPASWAVHNPRFGDVVVRAPLGTAIVTNATLISGFHGYDSQLPEMAGMLIAHGRGIEPGTRIGRVSNLAIAPTVLRLLDLPVPEQMRTPPIAGMLHGLTPDADTP